MLLRGSGWKTLSSSQFCCLIVSHRPTLSVSLYLSFCLCTMKIVSLSISHRIPSQPPFVVNSFLPLEQYPILYCVWWASSSFPLLLQPFVLALSPNGISMGAPLSPSSGDLCVRYGAAGEDGNGKAPSSHRRNPFSTETISPENSIMSPAEHTKGKFAFTSNPRISNKTEMWHHFHLAHLLIQQRWKGMLIPGVGVGVSQVTYGLFLGS